MTITAEEKLMYQVMKAIYDGGIPVSFKGSMVLKACLLEAGYAKETRHTVDIDGNWNSETPPSAEQMVESIQGAIGKQGIELDVSLYRMYSKGRSAGFELTDRGTGEVLFSMDIDVNRPVPPTKMYEVEGLHFRGVAPVQMIADKVAAISSDKVFRRIKDVVDLYYLSKVFDFDKDDVLQRLNDSGRELGSFHGFLNRRDELEYSYEKFRFMGDVEKAPFEEIYSEVKEYIRAVLPMEGSMEEL